MTDIFLMILGLSLVLVSIAGAILPVIPGPPIAFIGLFILRFTSYVEDSRAERFDNILWIFFFVTIVVTILDYLVPLWGAKKFGASKAGMWGAGVGVFAGLFFPPLGLIIMPFIGAVLGEMLTGRDERTSFRAGVGSFIGFLSGVLLKLIACILMIYYYIAELVLTGSGV
jgi:uncharacterized protein